MKNAFSRRFLLRSSLLLTPALFLFHPQLQAQENSMHHYVMLFRGTRALTPEELQTRAKELQEWIQKVAAMGIHLDPRPLGDTIANL